MDTLQGVSTTSSTGCIRVHGNAKTGEPPYMLRRSSKTRKPPRQAAHIHAKPWSSCGAPGRNENPHQENVFHRTWSIDSGIHVHDRGNPRRWNRQKKKEYYAELDAELSKMQCHDDKFAVGSNAKFWTCLKGNGTQPGGQEEMLDYCTTRGHNHTGKHLKGGLYKGKFSEVKHAQIVFKTVKQGKKNVLTREIDIRPAFDNRLHDDVIRRHEETDKDLARMNLDVNRLSQTRSCSEMGVEFMHR